MNERGGCGDEFEASTDCNEGIDDVCEPPQPDPCAEVDEAWIRCIQDFCAANPDFSGC
jgi:hypothetical protein